MHRLLSAENKTCKKARLCYASIAFRHFSVRQRVESEFLRVFPVRNIASVP
jgi:hypothetical protein